MKPSDDLVELMKAQFTSFRMDLQDMRGEMASTIKSRFTSFESKLTDTVMKVVHEQTDSVKKMFTVNILKIGTPKINAIIVLQMEQLDFTVQFCVQKMQTE